MQNLLDPAILFFVFGVIAGWLRSDLEIPAATAKFLSLYLLMALGLKGGFALAASGLNPSVMISLFAAILMAFIVPALGYLFLKNRVDRFDAAAVAASVEALTKAMLAGDRAGMMAVTHERLSYGHSAGRIENRQQFIDPLANKTSIFRSLNVSDQTIDVVGDDAIVRHVLRGESESNGRVNPVNIGILQVWKKQPDGWKLLARQAFTRPS